MQGVEGIIRDGVIHTKAAVNARHFSCSLSSQQHLNHSACRDLAGGCGTPLLHLPPHLCSRALQPSGELQRAKSVALCGTLCGVASHGKNYPLFSAILSSIIKYGLKSFCEAKKKQIGCNIHLCCIPNCVEIKKRCHVVQHTMQRSRRHKRRHCRHEV